jgi:RNA polymerase sigma-70 factor (ECF subfamily)
MRETGSIHVKIKGGSVADTAKRTGMSESAVKIGIDRGLMALAASIRAPE